MPRRSLGLSAFTVGLLAIALSVGNGTSAWASGVNQPATAPAAGIGVNHTGSNDHCAPGEQYSYCRSDLWRLPNLLLADKVTVAWSHLGSRGPTLCLTGNVDRYSWSANHCNIAGSAYGSSAGNRSVFSVGRAAAPAFLEFRDQDCFGSCGYYGPYEFTVESIQHRLNASLRPGTTVPRAGTVIGRAALTNGRPVTNGTRFYLVVKVGTRKWLYAATSVNGVLTFKTRLPLAVRAKAASVWITRPATATSQLVRTTPQRRIVR